MPIIGDLITHWFCDDFIGIIIGSSWDSERQDWKMKVQWVGNENLDWIWGSDCKKIA